MTRKPALGVLCGCIAVVLVMTGCLGGGGKGHPPPPATTTQKRVTAVGPEFLSPAGLADAAAHLKQTIYWVGPLKGDSYEFTRTSNGDAYVRYLPKGVNVGTKRTGYLIVATYPFSGAYAGLKKAAGSKGVSGPGGRLVYVRPNDPKSVLVAFPGVEAQIEVYDPRPARSLQVAKSVQLKPVG